MSDDENDRSDEDVAYHELFENAQKAIHSSEANQRRSKAIREELEAYIDSASEMKGSDGNVLIRIPTNFDTIVNSMNRDDLSAETNEEKPWSQYLLLDGLNAEDDKEYNGRYARSFRDTPDVKIKRGLAQIQLLDRQLQEITRANHVENETSSPRADETFITTKHARATGELSPAAKKDAKRDIIAASSKKSTNKNSIEKDREQQRLAYLLSIEPDDEKGAETYWDPDLQAANDAIDERLAAFGRWGEGTSTATTEAENNDPANADAETAFNEPTAGEERNNNNNNNNSNNSKRERKVDYLHELREVRLQNERMKRLDALIDTCSNHPIEYQALLPKAPVIKQKQQLQNQSSNSSSSSKGSPSRSPHTVRSPLGTAGSSTRRSIISNSNSSVAGDVLAVPDPTEVQPDRVVTYEDIQELLALLSGSAGGEAASHSKEAFSAGTATSPVASPSSARSYALSHKQQDASFSPHSPSAAAATGEGGPNCIDTTPASSSSFSSSIRSHGHGATVDIREGIKALVRQHKKDIEALGRLRARYHSNHSNLPDVTTTVGHDTQEEEEDEATQDMLAKKISNVSSTNGRTQHSTSDEDDDHGDNNNKNYNDNNNDTRVERWLDWNEEVPTSTINAAHPAVAAAVAAGMHVGSAKKPRVTAGSSGTTHADAGGEHLPPLPPLSSSSHSAISDEARGVMQSSHFIQSSSSKSQSASLATDYEDTSSSPPRPAAAAAAVGATSSVVKKSLRLLPCGPVTAPSSAIAATADAAMAAAMAAAARADHPPPEGLTVFRSINSELERQQRQQHAANGARLVKKIGAVLAAERDSTHHRRIGADGAAGSNNNIDHHAHYHHRQHHHHRQQHQEHHHHQLQQQQSGDPAEHVSPSSARRALKARNVLDSMTSSSSTFSTTNTLGSPSGATATPTTKDASYSNVMRI